MTQRLAQKNKLLPANFLVRITYDDLKEAICGSPTRCAIAYAIRRILSLLGPPPSFVSVKANRVTVTWRGMLYHFELPNKALKLVAQNDDGTLSFMPGQDRTVKLPRVRVRPANTALSDERKEQIRTSNKRRREAGVRYTKNTRFLASKEQGRALKHLQRKQAAQAQAEAY